MPGPGAVHAGGDRHDDRGGGPGRGVAVNRNGGVTKARRQQAILSLLGRERLGSQEDIRTRLRRMGLPATQSTISRDIEELGLARVHDQEGVRYVVPDRGLSSAPTSLLRRSEEHTSELQSREK